MAMSHYYECPFCGNDYVNGNCERPECLSKRKKDLEKTRYRNEEYKKVMKKE